MLDIFTGKLGLPVVPYRADWLLDGRGRTPLSRISNCTVQDVI